MEYAIYTYGGGDTLIAVFEAIAMLFRSNDTYLSPIAKMGFAIGGVYIAAVAMFKGQLGLFTNKWLIPAMFTYMFLFLPKETVWIKDEASLEAPRKIDHIPAGIAVFTSIASQVAHFGAKELEDVMLPPNAPRAAVGGIMYGAKAVAKIRDFRIEDPILLHNTKEYLRQCYMWPYVIGNFGGHKAEAIRATDVLGFLEKNPVKCFGIKPIGSDGSVGKFQTCTEAGKVIKAALDKVSKDPVVISKLGAALGMSGSNKVLMQKRIKAMTSGTLDYLEQSQTEVHEWVKQAMVLNANREAYDDQRESLGISRVYPDLVRMQAARGLAQDTLGSIIGAEMSEALIPASAQPVMLSIIVLSFIILLPLSLMPSGWTYIVNGVKAIIWVCSWPLFYTIIAAIGMIQLKNAVGAWGEEGLTLLGQAGFTELMHLQYAATQKLISMVPVISFAIVWGSPYAFSSIAGAVSGASVAANLGASSADNNLDTGRISRDNTTKNQHTEAPYLKMGGGIVDDGAMSVMTDSNGKEIVTQYQDQMAVNYKTTDTASQQGSLMLANSKSDMASNTERYSTQQSLVNSQGTDFAKKFATGDVVIDGISTTELDSFRDSFGINSATQSTNSVSDSKTTGTSASAGLSVPGPISAVTGATGSTSTNAANIEDIRQDMSEQERQQFDSTLEKVYQAARSGNFQTTSGADRSLGESLGSNLTKLDQLGQERAKIQQNIDTYTDQLQYLESNTATIDRNVNNEVISEVMRTHPELRNKAAALRYMSSHRGEADAIAARVGEKYNPFSGGYGAQKMQELQKNAPSIQNMEIPTRSSLEDKYRDDAQKVQKQAVVKDATGTEKPVQEIVENNLKDSNLRYNNKSNQEVLKEKITDNPEMQNHLKKLENEKDQVKGSDSQDTMTQVKKKHKKMEGAVGKSAALRVVEDIGNTTNTVLDKITGDDKKNGDKK